MTKGIIFDLDGLLIDSEPAWREGDFLFARKYGFPLSDKFRKQLFGRGLKENAESFIHTYHLSLTTDLITKERLRFLYKVLFRRLKLHTYARWLITMLSRRDVLFALATVGHEKTIVVKILKKLDIFPYFSCILGSSDIEKAKPDPEIYLKTAKCLDLLPSACIVLEDSVSGVLSGKAAGMMAIGINRDKEIRKRLELAKADFTFSNLHVPLSVFGFPDEKR